MLVLLMLTSFSTALPISGHCTWNLNRNYFGVGKRINVDADDCGGDDIDLDIDLLNISHVRIDLTLDLDIWERYVALARVWY